MKKMIVAAAIACVAAFAQAATVGWSAGGIGSSFPECAYKFFVIGQNDATIADVTKDLNAGKSIDSYAFASGKTTATGALSQSASAAGAPTLDQGEYTAFIVLFDSGAPKAGESKYVLISGQSGFTKTIGASTAAVTFTGGNVSSIVSNADNWKSFGAPGPGPDPTPEPTSGLLLLVGGAMLALRRKQK